MKMVLQFGFGEVFSWENQEMKQKQKKDIQFSGSKQPNRVFFFEDIESPSVWLRFSFVNHFVSGYASKALGLVPLFDDMKAIGWRRRQVFWVVKWWTGLTPVWKIGILDVATTPQKFNIDILDTKK